MTNQRPVSDLLGPIRGKYSGNVKYRDSILTEDGDAADEELEEYDTHAPPVHRVALSEDNLRDVLRGPEHLRVAELPGLLVDVALVKVVGRGHDPHLDQPEDSELDVAQGGNQEGCLASGDTPQPARSRQNRTWR